MSLSRTSLNAFITSPRWNQDWPAQIASGCLMTVSRVIRSRIGRLEPWPLTIRMRRKPWRTSDEQTQTPYFTSTSQSTSMVPGQSM